MKKSKLTQNDLRFIAERMVKVKRLYGEQMAARYAKDMETYEKLPTGSVAKFLFLMNVIDSE